MSVRVLRLKLFPLGNKEQRMDTWVRIRQLDALTFRAANQIVSSQYFNDFFMNASLARLKLDPESPEFRQQLSEHEDKFIELFGVKRQAAGERDIKSLFPDLPPAVTNSLVQEVYSAYRRRKPEITRGDRSIDTYRRGLPIPLRPGAIRFRRDHRNRINAVCTLSRSETLNFGIMFGKDHAGYRNIVERVMIDELTAGAPKLQLRRPRDRALYLLLPIKYVDIRNDLDPERCLSVRIGRDSIATLGFTQSMHTLRIGDRSEFLRVRAQFADRRQRIQKAVVHSRGGHGRGKKLRAIRNLGNKERRFANSINHSISAKIIKLAKSERCGTIIIEMLSGFPGINEKMMRYWSYYELQQMITYKAKAIGATVVYADPTGLPEEDEKAARALLTAPRVINVEQCKYYRLGAQPDGEGGNIAAITH